MGIYAKDTSVPMDRSKAEIERTLSRYGADQFIYGWDKNCAIIGFRYVRYSVKIRLPLPSMEEMKLTATGKERTNSAIMQAMEQEKRRRWRAMVLIIKAKLEAVETGIVSFEDEFLGYIMLPGGQTTGEWMKPQLEESYSTGKMPKSMLLLGQ